MIIFAVQKERCRSGRSGQSRKLLNSLWVPGVRIPLSPQEKSLSASRPGFFHFDETGKQACMDQRNGKTVQRRQTSSFSSCKGPRGKRQGKWTACLPQAKSPFPRLHLNTATYQVHIPTFIHIPPSQISSKSFIPLPQSLGQSFPCIIFHFLDTRYHKLNLYES